MTHLFLFIPFHSIPFHFHPSPPAPPTTTITPRKKEMENSFLQVSPKGAAAAAGSDSSSDPGDRVQNQRIFALSGDLISIEDSFQKKERSRFVTSQVPTDLTIRVQDISFHVHKYPLLSRCGYIRQLLDQQQTLPDSSSEPELQIEGFPGGPDTFETVLKFCYGLPIDLTPATTAPLRCAAEFLEMTEDLEPGNLIFKTESFLSVLLSSWRSSVSILKSSESLSPWPENLQIIRRCCDSIAWMASRRALDGDESKLFYGMSTLRIDHFVRIVAGMRAKGARPEAIGGCISRYAERWLDGFDREECPEGQPHELQVSIWSGRQREAGLGGLRSKDQRAVVESLVSILPQEREAVPCAFLLQLLRAAVVYSASPALVSELEKKVGMVLENASVGDLLIPNCSGSSSAEETGTMHDVGMVQRMVEYFLMHDQHQQECGEGEEEIGSYGRVAVAKLLDGYLAEIGKDPNLSITKFQQLAEALPESSRTCDDGLYRAIDTYLKSHPSLMEHERRRICRVMTCEKLSPDACMHAVHNERLPLRNVVQVLLTEQVKMKETIEELRRGSQSNQSLITQKIMMISWSSKEINSLKTELECVKGEMEEMLKDYSEMQMEFEKLVLMMNKQKCGGKWSSGWRKIRNSSLFVDNGKMADDEETTMEAVQQKNGQRTLRHSQRVSIS